MSKLKISLIFILSLTLPLFLFACTKESVLQPLLPGSDFLSSSWISKNAYTLCPTDKEEEVILPSKTHSWSDGVNLQTSFLLQLAAQPDLGLNQPLTLEFLINEFYYFGQDLADFSYHGQITFSQDLKEIQKYPLLLQTFEHAFGLAENELKETFSTIADTKLEIKDGIGYLEANQEKIQAPVNPDDLLNLYFYAYYLDITQGFESLSTSDLDQLHQLLNQTTGLSINFYTQELRLLGEIDYQSTWDKFVVDLPLVVNTDLSSLPITANTTVNLQGQLQFKDHYLDKIALKASFEGQIKTNFPEKNRDFIFQVQALIQFLPDQYTYLTQAQKDLYLPVNQTLITPGYILISFAQDFASYDNMPDAVGYLEIADQPIYFYDTDRDGLYEYWSEFPYLDEDDLIEENSDNVIIYLDESNPDTLIMTLTGSTTPLSLNQTQIQPGFFNPFLITPTSAGRAFMPPVDLAPGQTFLPSEYYIKIFGYADYKGRRIYLYDSDDDGIFDCWSSNFEPNVFHVQMIGSMHNLNASTVMDKGVNMPYLYWVMHGTQYSFGQQPIYMNEITVVHVTKDMDLSIYQ